MVRCNLSRFPRVESRLLCHGKKQSDVQELTYILVVVEMMVSLETRNQTIVAVEITLNVAVHFEMRRWKKGCCLRSRYMVVGDLGISLLYPKNKDKRKVKEKQT